MTKILFIGNAASPHFAKWVDYFKRDFEVILVTDKEGELGLKTYRAKSGRGALQIWRLHQKLKEAIKKEKPDIVHVHYVSKYGWPTLGCKIKRLVCTIWGSDIRLSKGVIQKTLTNRGLKKALVVTSDSENIINSVKKGVHINFGVDTKRFTRKKKLGSTSLIYTRGFKEIYDVGTLMRAIEILNKKGKNIEATLCGGGYESTKKEWGHIKGLRFVGKVPPGEMEKYYENAGIYVSTSKYDAGISAGTAEAMAMELPVIVSDVCENKSWIENGKNGLLFEYGNEKDLSKKIEYLLEHPNERRKLGENARRIIVQKNDYATEMEKMSKIYKSLLGC